MNATSVSIPSVRDGRNLKTAPWGHQQLAIDFLREVLHKPHRRAYGAFHHCDDGGGAYLAMGMGTGKTLVAESMAFNLSLDSFPMVLVASPLRVVPVWPVQIDRHCGRPDVRVVALHDRIGTVADKMCLAMRQAEIARVRGERLVVIINYESLWRAPFSKWALAQTWGLTILDECHRIKQPSGRASMYCARLRDRSVYRLALSGTPMPHSPLDVYAQYRFLDPTIYGTSYSVHKQAYAVMGGFQAKQIVGFRNLDDFNGKMGRIMFRVGKEVLDLPPETRVTYECDLNPAARRVYDRLEEEFVAGVHNGTVTVANAMVLVGKLAQMTGGFVKDDTGTVRAVAEGERNAKADLLADTLEDIAPDEPVVVFCRFHADLDVVHAIVKAMGRKSLELSGRRDELPEWQSGDAPLLAVQISAGGIGVDMTRARYSIYFSLSYSLGEYDQSLSRVHRPGQTRPVTHIHLVVRDSVDERIVRALEKRAEVVNSILAEIKEQRQ
jgi:SNF2 family DNA or RNA helicase